MFGKQDVVLDAILKEARDAGLPGPILALISKMYDDQQELRRCYEGLMHGRKWELEQLEKRIVKIEEKIDPEEKKCEEMAGERDVAAGGACNLPTPGVLG